MPALRLKKCNKMMATIEQLLKNSQLVNSPSERLDKELLLAAALNKPRSYLYTWADQTVSEQALAVFNSYLARRQQGEPIAYILGEQGFWSLELQVGKQTLIPRADTETLVEQCLLHIPQGECCRVLDLGTGTGAIALAIASERPFAQVVGVDLIGEAVSLAQSNASRLHIRNVAFIKSHWFDALQGERFDLIISNPPYIAEDDIHLQQGDVRFEPKSALVSGHDGLNDIRHIIKHAPNHLLANGWLYFEHGYQQAAAVQQLMIDRGFSHISTARDLGGNERVTGGQLC